MEKRLLTFGILVVVLGVVFIPAVSSAQESIVGSLVSPLFKMIGQMLMMIAGFFLYLTGSLFDLVVEYTVLEMGRNLSNASGLGGGINRAWTVLRDISNMCFIFVLLYAAFKAMFQLNPSSMGTVVKNIIIAALLINFSLFLSKVVIDASNIVSSGFYRSIVSANSTTLTINPANNQTTTVNRTLSGISAGYMSVLGIQNFYNPNVLTNSTMGAMDILVTGVMGAIFMLVVAVIFLVSAIMFLARFIILIFLMILSPLAVVSAVIPGKSSHFTDWKEALLEQSFFAPLFFALTWVSLKVASTPGLIRTLDTRDYTRIMTEASTSTGALVLNYVLVIGLAIAALVFAKTMAMKGAVGSKYFGKMIDTMGANRVAGVVGGATLGGAAAFGRRTIGAGASRLAQSRALSNWAGRSWIGQKAKEGTEAIAKSSFDVRQTKSIGGALQGTALGSFGTGKAGGYDATLQAQIAKKEKVAAGLKTDQARQAYAQRQLSGISRYARGGSAPWHAWSLLGTLGRSNRIVASRVLNNQITALRTDLNNGNTELTRYQNVLNGGGALNPTQQARYNTLTGPVGMNGSLADIQDQINTLQGQINTWGITNPSNTTRGGRPLRADEQNY